MFHNQSRLLSYKNLNRHLQTISQVVAKSVTLIITDLIICFVMEINCLKNLSIMLTVCIDKHIPPHKSTAFQHSAFPANEKQMLVILNY